MTGSVSPLGARRKLFDALPAGSQEGLGPLQAVGRRTARPLMLPRSEPAHPLSAMDGYAVRDADVPGTLPVVAETTPGDPAPGALEEQTAMRSLTGAPVPDNADHVVPLENVREKGDAIHVPTRPSKSNIVPTGRAVQAGERISSGTRIDPGLAETLASQGFDRVPVRDLPPIQIAPLGDELVDGTVNDTVAPLIDHLLADEPGIVERLAPQPDSETVLEALMADAPEILITTGGTGPSKRDAANAYDGNNRLFDGVNVKPGKPVQASRTGPQGVWIALPGNPTSALFTFRTLVLPVLRKHLTVGRAVDTKRAVHRVRTPIDGHPKKWKIVPVHLDREGISPVGEGPSLATGWWRGSDGLVLLRPATRLDEGTRAEVLFW